ncbi:MAG: ATP-binding protein, partial [Methanocorpusculum sp.]|nr:ATP-binding protein [Methanocorpusculum sp.]
MSETEPKKIPKRVTTALVQSLSAGTTPRVGLEYITIGRKKEVDVLLNDLENTREGGSSFKFIIGKYGSGKSFMLQAIRNYAMDRNFVVMDVDLSPERRLSGANYGIATYRELIRNMATKTKPNGGALESVIQKWINSLKREVLNGFGDAAMLYGDNILLKTVTDRIYSAISDMEMMIHEYDFAKVLAAYWIGYNAEGKDEFARNAMKWLRGEYGGKREAKKDLGVDVIIDDKDWYEYIKLWAEFVTGIGYSGLVVFFDEAKTLGNIPHTVSRTSNYEKLLTIFNETMQGRVSHLSILMSGTDEFVKDPKRGLFSYEALRSRLDDGKYGEIDGKRNYDAPLMPLQVLSPEEIFYLLQKLREIHAIHYNYEPTVTDDNLEE